MISEKEYAKRRKKLAKSLEPNSLAILYSAEYKQRSNDTEYPYRQNSNFYYLSGFKEDGAALVFTKNKKSTKTYLFVTKKDPKMELWTGKRVGRDAAKEQFLVDDVFEYEELHEKLEEFAADVQRCYYDFKELARKTDGLKSHLKNVSAYINLRPFIEKMRLIKSRAEIKIIKQALAITKEAHHRAMQISKTMGYEYELQAEIEYCFKKNGAYSDAYTTIVASANAANTLHYISNNQKLRSGDLILIDAGCEYDYYASDITRTIPVNGKFLKHQKELYAMVLGVNKKIIEMIKPNILRSELQKSSEELLCQGLIELGILKGDFQKIMDEKLYKKYYPHGIGHWMGLDVHDECPYKDEEANEIPLQPGMVLTIEPGIYLDKDDESIPKKYRGIGIRIEDDILVTKYGCENLSSEIVKEIEDIEMKSYS